MLMRNKMELMVSITILKSLNRSKLAKSKVQTKFELKCKEKFAYFDTSFSQYSFMFYYYRCYECFRTFDDNNCNSLATF